VDWRERVKSFVDVKQQRSETSAIPFYSVVQCRLMHVPFQLCDQGSILAICSCLIIRSPNENAFLTLTGSIRDQGPVVSSPFSLNGG
jgi:hypothetical protein